MPPGDWPSATAWPSRPPSTSSSRPATPWPSRYPPDVQAELAAGVADAGRAVLLEKPIALDLASRPAADGGDRRRRRRVPTRPHQPLPAVDAERSCAEVEGFGAVAGRATFLGDGATPGSYFGTPWRLEQGGLLDLGPHVLDALDIALGPIVEIEAVGDPLGVVALTCAHEGGAISQATISATTPNDAGGLTLELIGPAGRRRARHRSRRRHRRVRRHPRRDGDVGRGVRRTPCDRDGRPASTCTADSTCSGCSTTPADSCARRVDHDAYAHPTPRTNLGGR